MQKPAAMQHKMEMEWIDLSNAPNGTKETRARVRSHAMKQTGDARKRSTTWGKQNMRQLPEFRRTRQPDRGYAPLRPREKSSDNHATTIDNGTPELSGSNTRSLTKQPIIPRPLPQTGVELLAAQAGIHVLDLSALTDIQCVWTACVMLTGKKDLAKGLIGSRRPSYIHDVARRYGSSPCLDEALRCVALRAKKVMSPVIEPPDQVESRQYVKALQSLQRAVDDDEERKQPEVLAAINLLSLYELLRYTPDQLWFLHIGGASRLIRARGPASFVSDFDIRLVLSMIISITHESMKNNEVCYFEEEDWQKMLRSFVVDGNPMSSRSALNISILSLMVRVPRLLKDTCAVVEQGLTTPSPELVDLRDRLRMYRRELLRWRAVYDLAALTRPASKLNDDVVDDIRAELLGNFLVLSISCARLLGAINVEQIDILEDEAFTYAKEMLKLESDSLIANQPMASFYLGQKSIIAHATLCTTSTWREVSDRSAVTIEYSKFTLWLSAVLFRRDIERDTAFV